MRLYNGSSCGDTDADDKFKCERIPCREINNYRIEISNILMLTTILRMI